MSEPAPAAGESRGAPRPATESELLSTLFELGREVTAVLDLEELLAKIPQLIARLTKFSAFSVYLLDEKKHELRIAYAVGYPDAALLNMRLRVGQGVVGAAVEEGRPILVNDIRQEPRYMGPLRNMLSQLAVPMRRKGKVIGALNLLNESEGAFTLQDEALLRQFAAHVAVAIENARLFRDAERERAAAETALSDLRRAQDRLVQAEKMASLGQLTAGIAHEIKNPLNFVNNFAELSVDLLDELHDAVTSNLATESEEIATMLKSNLARIAEHGRRADSIVKNMLLHSRSGPSESRSVDLNAVIEEALNLAYHGARAETPGFNITIERRLDPAAGMVEMFPQDFTRVMLNLIANGFYAARQRADANGISAFAPTLTLTTRDQGDQVEIRVRDNGTGIASDVREKIFEPFFTTKPAGEGTGLGLSLSYDIVVKQHGGQLIVDSRPNEFTEFCITLPRRLAANEGVLV